MLRLNDCEVINQRQEKNYSIPNCNSRNPLFVRLDSPSPSPRVGWARGEEREEGGGRREEGGGRREEGREERGGGGGRKEEGASRFPNTRIA